MKRNLPLAVFSIAIIFTAYFFLSAIKPIVISKEGNDKQNDAQWYLDYLQKMRANQLTGKIDPNDVLQAYRQLDQNISARSLGIQWQELGPDNIGGRTRAILFDSKQPGIVFAGGVSGGLWKSTNSGQSWQPVGLDWPAITVSCICEASNGDLYVGTGEGLYYNFGIGAGGFPGQGVFKSTDGGNTWTQLPATIPQNIVPYGGEAWIDVNRLAASPDNPNRIYAATATGIQITADGGNTWYSAKLSDQVFGAASTDIKIGSDGFVHASLDNLYFRSVVADGDSFAINSKYFPIGAASRVELCVSPTNPHFVYATVADAGGALGGVWQSKDGGITWSQIGPSESSQFNPFGNQGDYDIAFGALPSDSNTIFLGGQVGLYRYRPTDGWVQIVNTYAGSIAGWIIHPDLHAISFNPYNTKQMAVGCDGGIYMTNDDTQDFPVFYGANRNYRVTQMYSVAAAYTGEVMGGTQDNGTPYINFLGNSPLSGVDITGGDGGYSYISTSNPNAFFAANPGGVLLRSANKGQTFSCFFDTRIDANSDCQMDENAEFVTPFTLWENGDGSIAFYATGGDKHAWLTPQALNFSTDANWFQFPALNASATCVQFTPDGNTLFVGTSGGMLYRYSGIYNAYVAGKFKYASISSPASSWIPSDNGIKISSYSIAGGRYLRAIAIDPANPENIVITAANYGNTQYVWKSNNALDSLWSFADITGNLIKAPVYAAAIDPYNPNNLIVGTEFGVWSSDLSNPGIWSEENANGMSRVPTLMAHFINFENEDYLYVGTHGRGIFRSGTLAGVVNGVNEPSANLQDAEVFPSPAQYQATITLSLNKESQVIISVYDLEGKLLNQTISKFPAGKHSANINIDDLIAGTYLVNIRCGNDQWTRKLVVIH